MSNIKTLDGEDFTFPSNKTIVLFMFSSIDNLWHQISNPAAGGANTTLSNLGTTSINAHLIPDGNQYLGSATDPNGIPGNGANQPFTKTLRQAIIVKHLEIIG